ncbi:chemotaxis protein CheY [Marinomonas sp. SBI22]|uniref:response regulator n=1 Tax=unclassified Marinomonas TaxID=196814 RepID=UPI0007AFCC93|nr:MULTISPECIES: response regulator [unclassified Marinomonas]KZM38976.1 chemotaxis protein CheY [Marinomonas sp. SBI22]KZM39663.1 chemotaxis protein CheY [Marinomonas sp. SBI8L]
MSITILLIEDDDVDAIGINRSFVKAGLKNEIVRAKNGKEALHLLKMGVVGYPFIILLDLNMPMMDGLEFLTYLREYEKFKQSIVYVLTTSKSEQDIALSFDKNVAGYFIKNEVGTGYDSIVEFLGSYMKIAHFPKSV